MAEPKSRLELIASTVQVLSVVVGVVLSVLSVNSTRLKEAEARRLEAEKPFQELRRTVYVEAVKNAAILANPEGRTATELSTARRRFRELYVAELSMVEDASVSQRMVHLARAVDKDLGNLTESQVAALDLARALGESYAAK